MKTTDFSEYISKFFSSYLVNERGASKNTIISYRDTLVQLIKFMERVHNINVNKLQIKHLTAERIKEFLLWLEREKQVSTATRNARLTALHSFLKFVRYDNIDCLNEIQKIMAIKAEENIDCYSQISYHRRY